MIRKNRIYRSAGLQLLILLVFCQIVELPAAEKPAAADIFLIRTVDAADGRGIPLVELEAFNALTLQSDNLGNIAVTEPDLVGKTVRFLVRGHGYRVPQTDFFGERSITVKIEPGASFTVKLERTAIAERLYRITGSGRYRDSSLAGVDLAGQPFELAGDVLGLDSAVPVVWQNRLLSFYGDTLGPGRMNLSGSGAEIDLTRSGVPDRQLPLKFFTEQEGFASRMVPLPEPGFVWIETVVPLIADIDNDKEILACRYVIHKTLEEAVETGYAVFEELQGVFVPFRRMESSRPHKSARAVPVKYGDVSGYCLQPWERITRTLSAFSTPDEYEHYTCLTAVDPASAAYDACLIGGRYYEIERDSDGRPQMQWRRGTLPYDATVQKQLLKESAITTDETWMSLIELGSGRRIGDFTGSISYNQYRDRWIMFAQGNTGEIWYSEADTFTGPWLYARKIIEHDAYNFYNPVHHPWFDANDGRTTYIEGTFTAFFTPKEHKKPRSDYNQVMYRIQLDDERLYLPCPIYRVRQGKDGYRLWTAELVDRAGRWSDVEKVEFFAFDSDFGKPWLRAVYDHAANEDLEPELLFESAGGDDPVFYVIDSGDGTVEKPAQCAIFDELLIRKYGNVLRADNALLTFDPEIKPDSDVYKINATNSLSRRKP